MNIVKYLLNTTLKWLIKNEQIRKFQHLFNYNLSRTYKTKLFGYNGG